MLRKRLKIRRNPIVLWAKSPIALTLAPVWSQMRHAHPAVPCRESVMTLPPRLDAAMKRLEAALSHLEAAGERRIAAEGARGNLEEELMVMQDDRARLAAELDGALARARSLSLANTEVRQRLEQASDALRSMIGEPRPSGDSEGSD